MSNDTSHGWVPPQSVEEFTERVNQNAAGLLQQISSVVNRYLSERNDARSQLNTQQQTIFSLEEQITQLNLDLNIARAGHKTLAPSNIQPDSTTNSVFRSERFPDPDKFNGTRTKLTGFLTQLRMKLEMNDDRFRNEAAKVIYGVSRLEGRALDQVVPLVNANPIAPFSSVDAFVKYLESSFGDPDPRATARRELANLKQGTGDFSSYYTQFLRIVGYLDYNENGKIDALADGLSEDLKDAMIYQTERSQTLEDFAMILMKMDNKIRSRKQEQGNHIVGQLGFTNNPPHPSHVAGGLTSMDLSALRMASNQRPAPELRYTFSNGQRKTTLAEKQWRKDNNLCMYCAGSGHTFSNCPSANRSKPQPATMTGALLAPDITNKTTISPQDTTSNSVFQ